LGCGAEFSRSLPTEAAQPVDFSAPLSGTSGFPEKLGFGKAGIGGIKDANLG
jgi:hypothetical protein